MLLVNVFSFFLSIILCLGFQPSYFLNAVTSQTDVIVYYIVVVFDWRSWLLLLISQIDFRRVLDMIWHFVILFDWHFVILFDCLEKHCFKIYFLLYSFEEIVIDKLLWCSNSNSVFCLSFLAVGFFSFLCYCNDGFCCNYFASFFAINTKLYIDVH